LVGEIEGEILNGWDYINRELCMCPHLFIAASLQHTWKEENVLLTLTATGTKNTVDRNAYLNTTLPVQVVAPKLQERRLYQAMQIVDRALKARAQVQGKSGEVKL